MKTLAIALLVLASPAFASVSVKRATAKTVNVTIVDEPISGVVKAFGKYVPAKHINLMVKGDPHVTYTARDVAPEAALRAAAAEIGATLERRGDDYWITIPEPTVTLDVKDQDVRKILKSMQTQCQIKNLVIDPEVQGTGTFLFNEVPCRTAFDVVFRTLGLASMDYSNSLVTVGRRR